VAHVFETYLAAAQRIPDVQPLVVGGLVFYAITIDNLTRITLPVYAAAPPSRRTFVVLVLDLGDGDVSKICDALGIRRSPAENLSQEMETLKTLVLDAFKQKPALGIVKISWQIERRSFHECHIYVQAHGEEEWHPGLCRHGRSVRLSDVPIEAWESHTSTVGQTYSPVNFFVEAIELYSVGEPLSSCETVGEILEAYYDIFQSAYNVWRCIRFH
jgi:hypothetical protein